MDMSLSLASKGCGLPDYIVDDQASNDIIAGLMSWIDSSVSFATPPNSTTTTTTTTSSVRKTVVSMAHRSCVRHFMHHGVFVSYQFVHELQVVGGVVMERRPHARCSHEQDGPRVVFKTNRSLFLRNVFVRGADALLAAPHGMSPPLQASETTTEGTVMTSGWTQVRALAHGENPGPYKGHPEWQLQAPTFVQVGRVVWFASRVAWGCVFGCN